MDRIIQPDNQNIQTPESQPEIRQRPNHFKLILLLILIATLPSMGTYLVLQSKTTFMQSDNTVAVPTHVISDQPYPSSVPPPDETASWKKLESVYRYTIKYPSFWFVSPASLDRLGSVDQLLSYDVSKIKNPMGGAFGPGQTKLEIGKYNSAFDLSGVEESLNLSGANIKNKETTIIGSKAALKVVQISLGEELTTYYIEKGNREVYFIALYGDITGLNQRKIDLILSTFRFSE